MIYGSRARRQARPLGIWCWLAILAMSFLASMPILAQVSNVPEREESRPGSSQPARLYTEEEALAAARAAAETAVEAAVPLAVQAAVAEERGKAAAQQILNRAEVEGFLRKAENWRTASFIAAAAGAGALADGGRGAVYGAAGGAVAAFVWWVIENRPWGK